MLFFNQKIVTRKTSIVTRKIRSYNPYSNLALIQLHEVTHGLETAFHGLQYLIYGLQIDIYGLYIVFYVLYYLLYFNWLV